MSLRKKIFIGILICVALCIIGLSYFSEGRKDFLPEGVIVEGKKYTLEVANTLEKRTLGLGGRESLCASCAMLFTFPEPGEYPFWMKGMRFPLDIVWLSRGEIVHIERNISPSSEEVFVSREEADQVLEFNAGEAKHLRPGMNIRFVK